MRHPCEVTAATDGWDSSADPRPLRSTARIRSYMATHDERRAGFTRERSLVRSQVRPLNFAEETPLALCASRSGELSVSGRRSPHTGPSRGGPVGCVAFVI